MKFAENQNLYRVRGTRRLSPGCSLLVLGLFRWSSIFLRTWNVIKGLVNHSLFCRMPWDGQNASPQTKCIVLFLPDEPAAIENLEPGRYISCIGLVLI